jgi:hypothetical protein
MSSTPSSQPRRSAGPATRCPACGSRLRPEETWCSLCHHNLLAVPGTAAPLPVTEAAAGTAGPAGTAGTGVAGAAGAAPDGPEPERLSLVKSGSASAGPSTAVVSAADRLIAQLAAAEAERARTSGLGALHSRLGSRSGGVILAVVGGVVLLGAGVLGLSLLGLLL